MIYSTSLLSFPWHVTKPSSSYTHFRFTVQYWWICRAYNPFPPGAQQPHCWGFEITCRHTIFDRTPLNEGSFCRKDLNLTKKDVDKKHTPMSPTELEPEILTNERTQTDAKERSTGSALFSLNNLPLNITASEFNEFKYFLLICHKWIPKQFCPLLLLNFFAQLPNPVISTAQA
jgi:hypothetical protein